MASGQQRVCSVGFLLMLGFLLAVRSPAAEFAGGTGEPIDPYLIATAEQLISIGNESDLLSKHYRLVDDIDLDPNSAFGQVFAKAVIASSTNPYTTRRSKFSGRLYGDNHVIRHLTIDSNDGQYLGLFGYISSDGRVYDVRLENVNVTGAARSGTLAGYSEGSIVNCSASGSVTGGDFASWLGGLVGVNAGGMSGCRTDVTVTGGGDSSILGGMVGWHEGRILNCDASGSVVGGDGAFQLGGLVGRSLGGAIEDSHAAGSVSGGNRSWGVGGLVGREDSGSLMIRCYATGTVTAGAGAHDLGGLVGQNWYGSINYCYATSEVTAGQASHTLAGLVGSCVGGRITASYASGTVSAGAGTRLLGGLAGQVQTASVLKDCYAAGPLLVDGSFHGHGGLIGRIAGPDDARVVQCFWDTEVSGADHSAAGEGRTTAEMQDHLAYQAANWDLFGDASDGTANIWQLSEGGSHPTLTVFSDPNAVHILEGAGRSFDPYLIGTAEDLGVMIHHDRFAWFELAADIDLAGVTWTAPPVPSFYGVLDGRGHRIRNLTLRVDGTEPTGLFGSVEEGAWVFDLGLEDVSIEAADAATDIGGIAGMNAGNVVNCYVTGRIVGGAGSRSLGGLVGSNRQGAVADCYATTGVTGGLGSSQLGGLVGYNFLGAVTTCYAAGEVSSSGVPDRWGGLIGHNVDHTPVVGCYYLASDTGSTDLGTPLTDAQMKLPASFVDWNFGGTWMMCPGQTYPHFLWEHITCDP